MDRRWKGMGKAFVTPVTATAHSLVPDFETMESWGGWKRRFELLPNVGAKLALPDRFEERSHLTIFARRLKFHSAVAQIPHVTGQIEALRDFQRRGAAIPPFGSVSSFEGRNAPAGCRAANA